MRLLSQKGHADKEAMMQEISDRKTIGGQIDEGFNTESL